MQNNTRTISNTPSLKMYSLKSYLNKHLSVLLALLILGTSVLSSSHVHADEHLDHSGDSDQIEQCLAFHIADYQQASQISNFVFGEEPSHLYLATSQLTKDPYRHRTPPARGPPQNI